jgi:HAD superfamily hydrolase (TIGR01509 family)
MIYTHFLFDWGNTLMEDLPGQSGPMALWPEVKIVPGAFDVLRQLSQQGKCYIATNAEDSTAEQIRQALQRVGLETFINDIFCFQEIGFKKPDVAYFHAIIKHLDAPKSSVIMIGDSLEKDIQGAISAGIDAIWFNRYDNVFPQGVQSVARLDDLFDTL